jgi:ssDNA thymidine ADP-ribosyltransferase, DarT
VTTNDPLKRIPYLYHFTDRRNLDLIRGLGGLYPIAELLRKGVQVPAPGGNEWSWEANGWKGLDEYVHLCFRATHPMEFVARREGRIADSIFLSVHADVLQWEGVLFTSDVANKRGVQAYPIHEAAEMIDYEVLYTRTDWKNPDIRQRLLQAEKYEVLVPAPIPLEMIRNLPHG